MSLVLPVRDPLKKCIWEDIEIGETFGPVHAVVSEHLVKAHAFALDDYHRWTWGESSPFGRPIAHASILANDLLLIFESVYEDDIGLHTEEQLWFHNPVFIGERVVLTGQYVDKYMRRGKGYVVLESEARGEDGRLLLKHRGVEISRIDPGSVARAGSAEVPPDRKVTAEYRGDLEPVREAHSGLPVRAPLPPLVKQVHNDQMAVYSGIEIHRRNIHTDIEVARKGGVTKTIAQGMMVTCYLTDMLVRFFGESWFTTGWIKVKIIGPTYEADTITSRGAVLGETREEEGTRLDLEVWARNQFDQLNVVGWASAMVKE